jgi:hypothetical protein
MTERKTNRSKRGRTDIVGVPRDPGYTMTSFQNPIGMRLTTRVTYSEVIPYATVAFVDYQFRLNSLFDPNYTGTGHQPKGFDQLAAFYQRYRVYRVHWKISWVNTSGGATNPTILAVVPTNSASGYSSITDAMEAFHANWIVTRDAQVPLNNTIKGQIDLPLLNGKSRVAYAADDTTQSLTSASPSEVLQLHVVANTFDNSTALAGYAVVQLWFDTEFSDPIQLAQS